MCSKRPGISRRDFIKYGSVSTTGLLLGGLGLNRIFSERKPLTFKGKIVGANAKTGHLLRYGKFPEISKTKVTGTVIVGGGVSGLSAAWWLQRNGYNDFTLLELDENTGGNANSGQNGVSAYPWGAHYVPLPGPEAVYVKILFEELGIIRGYEKGLPVYDEYYLCADPHERILFQGRWHDGVIPQTGIPSEDKKQFDQFFAMIGKLKEARGSDGKRAFAIPVDLSSRDKQFTEFDTVSMADFMKTKGWDSVYLNWYINYCCRDDYGTTYDKVSAWAGIHYFASRTGAGANADAQAVVTWPEGNGWLVKKLAEKIPGKISKNSLVFKIHKAVDNGKIFIDYFDVKTGSSIRVVADNVIYAAPRYTAKYVIAESMGPVFEKKLSFTPWMVANLTLSEKPAGKGQELSWDNISYYSNSLGYIVAKHQDVSRKNLKTVITYYLPLSGGDPVAARKKAAQTDHAEWARMIVNDLEQMHPGISRTIENIDVWVWGHGMVSPGINYIWNTERQKMQESCGSIHFAHTDMTGISIFEEAQYRGIGAARRVLQKQHEGAGV